MTDNRKKLIAKCDDLWRQVIRVLNGKEPDDKTVEAAHIMRRSNMATRFDLKNGMVLKRRLHRELHHYGTEEEYFKKIIGEKEYERLRVKSTQVKRWEEWELESIVSQFESILKKI